MANERFDQSVWLLAAAVVQDSRQRDGQQATQPFTLLHGSVAGLNIAQNWFIVTTVTEFGIRCGNLNRQDGAAPYPVVPLASLMLASPKPPTCLCAARRLLAQAPVIKKRDYFWTASMLRQHRPRMREHKEAARDDRIAVSVSDMCDVMLSLPENELNNFGRIISSLWWLAKYIDNRVALMAATSVAFGSSWGSYLVFQLALSDCPE
ncbi:hypothetical protein [Azohydromonas caseinilytica]|uniref:Uncharacterized protein n=1 Tax=Azohydromonas caseinilytica TaxID=2728836 RepID=A0A848FIM4_9BURK|nr:hypothetical protein [Azohydromonas caseinilytica]NML18119.1 hypothetical protein [Azohydromonas caseinilytica]